MHVTAYPSDAVRLKRRRGHGARQEARRQPLWPSRTNQPARVYAWFACTRVCVACVRGVHGVRGVRGMYGLRAWRGVAWVAWRGVVWRGVAWQVAWHARTIRVWMPSFGGTGYA